MKNKIIEKIKEKKLIVILRNIPDDKLIKTVDALIAASANVIEITFNNSSEESILHSAAQIKKVKDYFGDKVYLGAGTVITTDEVIFAKEAGATFIISPNTDKAVIEKSVSEGLVSIPGAYTPTEVCAAYSYGADFVKLFPLGQNAVSYIKALKGPLSYIPMLAVSGVNKDNLKDVLAAGVLGVGIGTNIANGKEIANYTDEDFLKITENAKQFLVY